MTTEAPAKAANWMDKLTPAEREAHLAKMKAGREARAAKLAAEKAQATEPVDPRDARIRELEAKLASAPAPVDVSKLPKYDVCFEVRRPRGTTTEFIRDLDDPRWAEMSRGTPEWGNRPIHNGSLRIREIIYAQSGEVIGYKPDETTKTIDHPEALSRMRAHYEFGDHVKIPGAVKVNA
jgi:hypothetical protein